MSKIKFILVSGIVGAMMSATAASAVVTTFATFSPTSSVRNVRWVNSGVRSNNSASNTSTGKGGYFYSTATATSLIPSNVLVNFEFLLPDLLPLGTLPADFFMNVTEAPPSPAIKVGSIYIQNILTGGFSFTSKTAITVGVTTYPVGSNLLTGLFSNATIAGSGSSGAFSGNTVTYTSDLLNFALTSDRNFAMSMTSITGSLFASPGKALRTFRGVAGGSFASDPSPIVLGVPEPQVWGLMIVGFGMVGVQVRRARKPALAA